MKLQDFVNTLTEEEMKYPIEMKLIMFAEYNNCSQAEAIAIIYNELINYSLIKES